MYSFSSTFSKILIVDSGKNTTAILGQVFMKNYYIVFDQLNMKYGFAPLVGSTNLKPAI